MSIESLPFRRLKRAGGGGGGGGLGLGLALASEAVFLLALDFDNSDFFAARSSRRLRIPDSPASFPNSPNAATP